MTARELAFEFGDMRYAAKAWGAAQDRPVLALHGWLDNAASFDLLAPKLDGCYVVALDMAGHGRTSHRPYSGSYNIWDDLHDLISIADASGWEHFTLLAHSRGAMVALLLAVAAPQRIDRLIMLDSVVPRPVPIKRTAVQLQQHVRDFQRYAQRNKNPVRYATIEAATKARLQQMPMPESAAQLIVERSLQQVDGAYQWRYDERLKAASALKLCAGHNINIVSSLRTPTLLILAEQGIRTIRKPRGVLPKSAFIKEITVPGMHHCHMQEDSAGQIAGHVLRFLN